MIQSLKEGSLCHHFSHPLLFHFKPTHLENCRSFLCTKAKNQLRKEHLACNACGEKCNAHFYCTTCSDESRGAIVAVCGHGSFRGTECHSFHCLNPIYILCMLAVVTVYSCMPVELCNKLFGMNADKTCIFVTQCISVDFILKIKTNSSTCTVI